MKIGRALVRILNKYHHNQRCPRHFGLSEKLYAAEIHTIMLIGQYPSAGVTELANRSGTTKGAVSQMIQKLERKGLIERSGDPESGRRVNLRLTSKGKVAYFSHERMHEESDQPLISFLEKLNPDQIKLIEEFLSRIETGIDKRNET